MSFAGVIDGKNNELFAFHIKLSNIYIFVLVY